MKLVILDRDGVINEDSDEFIKHPDEWIPIPGSLESIAQLNRAGYQVVIVTNQSGLGRKLFDIQMLNQIHEKMFHKLSLLGGHIQAILFCPHRPEDNCDCRKPASGLFNELKKRLKISLDNVFAVGDSLRDLQAAKEAGAIPVLVCTGKGERTLKENVDLSGIQVYTNLAEFTDKLLSTGKSD